MATVRAPPYSSLPNSLGFISSAMLADGSYNHYWGIFAGGTAEPASEIALREGRTRVQIVKRYPPEINEQGWPRLVQQLARNGGFTLQDVDLFIFTQVRKPTIEHVMTGARPFDGARAHDHGRSWLHGISLRGHDAARLLFVKENCARAASSSWSAPELVTIRQVWPSACRSKRRN